METIGERIAKLRDIKSEECGHCTQQDLAVFADVEKNTVYKWEHNLVSLNAEKIDLLSQYFNVSCDYLIRGGSPEHLVMMNETGLSDETISILSEWRKEGFFHGVSDLLAVLVKKPFFLVALYDYLFSDFPKETEDYNYLHLTNGMERMARLFVLDQLQKIREEVKNGKS